MDFVQDTHRLAMMNLMLHDIESDEEKTGIRQGDTLSSAEQALPAADLMEKCDLHTILRLPTGSFYAQGVKTNVIFFTKGKKDTGSTREVWVYDLRANMPSFGKTAPFKAEHFADFVKYYGKDPLGHSQRTDQGEEEGQEGKDENARAVHDGGNKKHIDAAGKTAVDG